MIPGKLPLLSRKGQNSPRATSNKTLKEAVNVNQENLKNQEKPRKPKKGAVLMKVVKRNVPNTVVAIRVVQEKD